MTIQQFIAAMEAVSAKAACMPTDEDEIPPNDDPFDNAGHCPNCGLADDFLANNCCSECPYNS